MRIICLLSLYCVIGMSNAIVAGEPDANVVVQQVVDAAGGEEKLLRLFRTRETVNASSDPEKKCLSGSLSMSLPNTGGRGTKNESRMS